MIEFVTEACTVYVKARPTEDSGENGWQSEMNLIFYSFILPHVFLSKTIRLVYDHTHSILTCLCAVLSVRLERSVYISCVVLNITQRPKHLITTVNPRLVLSKPYD